MNVCFGEDHVARKHPLSIGVNAKGLRLSVKVAGTRVNETIPFAHVWACVRVLSHWLFIGLLIVAAILLGAAVFLFIGTNDLHVLWMPLAIVGFAAIGVAFLARGLGEFVPSEPSSVENKGTQPVSAVAYTHSLSEGATSPEPTADDGITLGQAILWPVFQITVVLLVIWIGSCVHN
jgi:hypothetical protein